jgi:hypothetical protein
MSDDAFDIRRPGDKGPGLTVFARRDPMLDKDPGDVADRRRWSLVLAALLSKNNTLAELREHVTPGRDEFIRVCRYQLARHQMKIEDFARIYNILKAQVTMGKKFHPHRILYWKGD